MTKKNSNSSIRLHPEHGLNPTIPVCFFCNKPRNEVALLGFNRGKKASTYTVIDYEPCDDCKAAMDLGIAFIEAEATGTPTGRFFVLTEDAAKRLLNPDVIDNVLAHRKCLMEPAVFNSIVSEIQLT